MKRFTSMYVTSDHAAGLVARITLAVVLFPHGCQMLFGWFGGSGFDGTMQYFTNNENLPWLVGFMVILLQTAGPLLLVAGLMTRLVALAMIPLFIGMIITSHWNHGFFMNWYGVMQGEGFEYHLLAIGLAVVLAFAGAGKYSLDLLFSQPSVRYIVDKTNRD